MLSIGSLVRKIKKLTLNYARCINPRDLLYNIASIGDNTVDRLSTGTHGDWRMPDKCSFLLLASYY